MIDCLPIRTRQAMLDGLRANDIIVGAYSDRAGGVCPMLAAHRCGGRTSFASFARAWDAFTGVKRARRATARELRVLESNLIASLATDAGSTELADVISAHQATARERRAREASESGAWSDAQAEAVGSGPPPGCRNWISGTTQPGEVLSR